MSPWIFFVLLTLLAFLVAAAALYPLLVAGGRAGRYQFCLLSLGLVLLSLGLYVKLGGYFAQRQYQQTQQLEREAKVTLKKLGSMQAVLERLKQRLAKTPNSAKGWYLLGKLYLGQQDNSAAFSAFSRAHALDNENKTYFIAYAESYFFTHDNQLSQKLVARLQALAERSPSNVAVINLLAINDYNQGRYAQAKQRWESVLPLFADESEDKKALLQMIAKAQKKMQ
jgi:cytochrome c-type biogenesis protein CcmH/NrfG